MRWTLGPLPVVNTSPTLAQHQSSAMNPLDKTTCPGNNYKIRLLESVGVGNCLILGITWGSGAAPTGIADDVNGAWPAATVTANAGSYDSRVYVFPNAAAGLAHLYHSNTDAQHWNWTIASDPTSGGMSVAVAFKGA